MTIEEIYLPEQLNVIIHGNSVNMYFGRTQIGDLKVFDASYEITTMEEGLDILGTVLLVAMTLADVFGNIFLVLVIILISTLMFLRYKSEINYKKIFKLVTFAVTHVALLITFYNLLAFESIMFFILTILAYRSLFILNRELYMQIVLRRMQKEEEKENIIKSNEKDDLEDDKSSKEDDDEQ